MSAAAYRKAMGLNLTEYSSGTKQGELHISKRGNPQTRRWLYLAALRQCKQAVVREWYQAKKQRDGAEAKRAVVGVMRKLVLALYQVGAKGATFEVGRLFGSKPADLAEQGGRHVEERLGSERGQKQRREKATEASVRRACPATFGKFPWRPRGTSKRVQRGPARAR